METNDLPKKSLLLVAHGSRVESSNEEIRALTRILAASAKEFDLVECAFLELAEPDIISGGESLISQGAKDMTVMPYFLVAGRHVVQDIPNEVDRLRDQNPEISIRITPYLGRSTDLVKVILEQVSIATGNSR